MRYSFVVACLLGCSSAEAGPSVGAVDSGVASVVDAPGDAPGEETETIVSAVSFHDVYTKVLGSCSSGYCHGGTAGGWSVIENEAATYDQLVGPSSTQCTGLARVEPGAPEKSALYLKARGGFGTVCRGKPMPPDGKLTAEQLELLRAWIAGGAPK